MLKKATAGNLLRVHDFTGWYSRMRLLVAFQQPAMGLSLVNNPRLL
jgi:hypothetical protein